MTKHSFSIKTLLLTIVVALSLLICGNVWAFAGLQQSYSASADSSKTATATESVVYYDFEADSGTYPCSPTSFEKVTSETSSAEAKPEASGVINLSSTVYNTYKTDYKLDTYTTKPESMSADNKQVLMINALNNSIYYGYSTKSASTLSANSYYEVSAAVYTHSEAIASVYLAGDDFDDLANSQIYKINTNNSWKTVTFLIATSTTKSSTMDIELFLGSKSHAGAGTASSANSSNYVLFDNVSVNRISAQNFTKKKDAASASELTKVVYLDESKLLESGDDGYITNGNFAAGSTGWSSEDNTGTSEITYATNLNQQMTINGSEVTFGTHLPLDSNKTGVVISAQNGGNVAIKSDDITIKQHHIYRIALWAKGALDGSTLNFKVSGTIANGTEDGLTCSAQYTALETNTADVNGGWGLYEFYVMGNPLYDTTVNLTLGLTSTNATDAGYVAITDIQSYVINTEQMSDGTSNNTNAKTVKMYSTENTLAFDNYSFNLVSIEGIDAAKTAYPLAPTSWTAGENNANSGVVNISAQEWANVPFTTTRPSKASLSGYSDNDNVLMLNAYTSGKMQSFTSATQTLDASGYAKISFQAYLNTDSNAFVTIKNSDGVVLAQMKLAKSTGTAGWKEYAIYIHNYMNSQTVSATLSLGQADRTVDGWAYFDNVKFDSSITQETFDAVTANATNVKFDLNTNALNATTTDVNSIEPLMWKLNVTENTSNTTINSGLIDWRQATSQTFINEEITNPEGNDSNMIMVIQANEPVYATYDSRLTYSLNASSYYKLTVWVRTSGLTPDTQTAEDYTVDGKLIVHGASVTMTNVDQSFTCINTLKGSESEWTEYTMYIYTNDAITSNIQLGLGCANMPTKGYAYFANLNFVSLTEDEYNNEILAYDTENLPANTLLATNVPEEEETAPSQPSQFDPFAFSTIVIALAVIAAVIGLTIKKVRQNAPKKSSKVSNNYDRLQTLMKDVDRRERKTAINHKLKLLREELEQSQTFLAQEVNDLRKLTESYNTAKEIAKDNPTIELDEPNVKQIQKEIEVQTAKINQIEQDIEVLEEEKARIEKQNKKSVNKRTVSQNHNKK